MLNILVVDDDVRIRRFLGRVLVKAGYQVAEAANGLEALTILKTDDVDGIITDVFMPEMDGMELIRAARKIDQQLIIIAVSGGYKRYNGSMLKPAKMLGADHTIKKPVDATELLDLIRRLIPLSAET